MQVRPGLYVGRTLLPASHHDIKVRMMNTTAEPQVAPVWAACSLLTWWRLRPQLPVRLRRRLRLQFLLLKLTLRLPVGILGELLRRTWFLSLDVIADKWYWMKIMMTGKMISKYI